MAFEGGDSQPDASPTAAAPQHGSDAKKAQVRQVTKPSEEPRSSANARPGSTSEVFEITEDNRAGK